MPRKARRTSDDPAPRPRRKAAARLGARRVIVAGYGLVGRAIADQLVKAGARVTVIERNADTVRRVADLGRSIVAGDTTDAAVLERAGVREADGLVLAVPDNEAVIDACAQARRLAPKLYIAARVTHASQGALARAAGADHVTVEELVTAQAMEHAVASYLARHVQRPTDGHRKAR